MNTPHIVIADDDRTSMSILQFALEEWGYSVVPFQSGVEAYNYLASHPETALAILDWVMPDMNGGEILRRISKIEGMLTYRILLTSRTDTRDVIEGIESGAHVFISKPFDPDELHVRITAGLRVHELESQLASYAQKMETLAEERALQLIHSDRLSSIGTLSAGIAHEINNPLSFIKSNIHYLVELLPEIQKSFRESLEKDPSQKEMRIALEELPEVLCATEEGVERILHIVQGLKLYARNTPSEKVPVSLAQILKDSLELCYNRLKYSIAVEQNLDETVFALADRYQLEQVFVNLILNAADAMEGISAPLLRIEMSSQNETAIVKISDNGSGFSETDQEKLFSPFFTTKEVGHGTGLGLSVCLGIVKEHAGTIIASNGESGGAVFRISLPRANTL